MGGALSDKPVDAVVFQKIKSLIEVNNDKCEEFEMEILDEVALDKELEGPGKTLDRKTCKKIYEFIDDEYLKQLDVVFPK